jgi:hypothetical protein
MKLAKFAGVGVLLGTFAAALSASPPAAACGGFYEAEYRAPKPKPVQVKPKPTTEEAISIAEPALQKEQPALAAAALADGFPKLRTSGIDTTRQETKALRAMALALARTDGSLSTPGPFFAATAAAKSQNLQWSIATLRKLNDARPNDPALQADLGEALAHSPGSQDEALRVLGALADKDIMGSAHAYAQLARLRAQKGDAAGSHEAAKRCQTMATVPAVCPALPEDAPKATAQPGV